MGGVNHFAWWLPLCVSLSFPPFSPFSCSPFSLSSLHLILDEISMSEDAKRAALLSPEERLGSIIATTISYANAFLSVVDPLHHELLSTEYGKKVAAGEFHDSLVRFPFSSLFSSSFPLTFLPFLQGSNPEWIWSGAALVKDKGVKAHLDKQDLKDGYAVMSPFGSFVGGQLYLPTLGLVLNYLEGDMVMIRARYVLHEVMGFKGAFVFPLSLFLPLPSALAVPSFPPPPLTISLLQSSPSSSFLLPFFHPSLSPPILPSLRPSCFFSQVLESPSSFSGTTMP